MLSLLFATLFFGLAFAMPAMPAMPDMPEMFVVQKMVHIRIIEFADHTRLVIKTTVVRIFQHCGKAFSPLPLPKMAALTGKLQAAADAQINATTGAKVAGNVALDNAAYSTAEMIIGMTIIGMLSTLVLFVLAFIGTFVYRRVTNQVEYMSLKQTEAALDEEEAMEEAAPAYISPEMATA